LVTFTLLQVQFILIKSFLLAQFDALNAELEHRRREQIEMKSKLQERVMQHENETDDVIATDAIEQAYQSQKQINKYIYSISFI
jgi:guanylate kinase